MIELVFFSDIDLWRLVYSDGDPDNDKSDEITADEAAKIKEAFIMHGAANEYGVGSIREI